MLHKHPGARLPLQQVSLHAWLRQPPSISSSSSSSSRPTTGAAAHQAKRASPAAAAGPLLVSTTSAPPLVTASSTTTTTAAADAGRFRPPPSYDREEEAAMRAPSHTLQVTAASIPSPSHHECKVCVYIVNNVYSTQLLLRTTTTTTTEPISYCHVYYYCNNYNKYNPALASEYFERRIVHVHRRWGQPNRPKEENQ